MLNMTRKAKLNKQIVKPFTKKKNLLEVSHPYDDALVICSKISMYNNLDSS